MIEQDDVSLLSMIDDHACRKIHFNAGEIIRLPWGIQSGYSPCCRNNIEELSNLSFVNVVNPYHCLTMGGYPKLASFMGANPEVAILRRFGALNARNLLYFQAELVALEAELKGFADQDSASDNEDRKEYSRCWDLLSRSDDNSNGGDETDGKQWQTMLRIRGKLKEYSSSKPIQRSSYFPISIFGGDTETSQTKRFCTKRRSRVFRSPTPKISPSSRIG